MIDREKVIKGLECCVLRDPDDSRRCAECPKSEYGRTISNSCINGLMTAALAMLKPVEPIIIHGEYECGFCKQEISPDQHNFCPVCGRKVKWE